jgi:purine-binding chemotaxis protein CheW
MNEKVQHLVFRVNDRYYGLRIAQIERVIRAVDCTPLPEAPPTVAGVIDLQGKIVPVLNPRQKFGFPHREIGVDDQFIIAVASGRTVAIVVDEVGGIVEHSTDEIFPAKAVLPQLEQIQGVIQLEDGLMLIHDLDQFLSLDEQRTLEEALTRSPIYGT